MEMQWSFRGFVKPHIARKLAITLHDDLHFSYRKWTWSKCNEGNERWINTFFDQIFFKYHKIIYGGTLDVTLS